MKTYKLIINPFAEIEIKETRNWYNLQKDNLGEEYLQEIKKTTIRIQENPLQFPKIKNKIRKVVISRFPFSIYFYIDELTINVFAVFHTSRNPMIWKERFDNK